MYYNLKNKKQDKERKKLNKLGVITLLNITQQTCNINKQFRKKNNIIKFKQKQRKKKQEII